MNAAERYHATYRFAPVDHLIRREFYIWEEAIERWIGEGLTKDHAQHARIFGLDEPGQAILGNLGWCEPAFVPAIQEKVLQETAEYQVIRDIAGRTVKFFKGRRHGFMPTYLKHAVTSDRDWHEEVAPLLSPQTPARRQMFDEGIAQPIESARNGVFITQTCVGGYMYLRSLVGPEEICYMLLDNPALVHKMMQAWLELADAVTAATQKHLQIDEFFIAEDICYNHGLLISPDMVREFLFPYYQQLLANIRKRQSKRVYFHVDTDGNCQRAVDLYLEIGLDMMSPWEIAAGNDVVEVARKYPQLRMLGGIDKRVLAAGPAAIDEYLDRVIPFMVKRGGYIPTCDHGVPDNVSLESYLHYRRRMMMLDH